VNKRISINSIAKELGISTTTISFVLNGKASEKRISEKLIKKVMDYIEEIGYKPSTLARSLRTGKTNIIGLIVEDISDPFFSTIARQIEERAYKSGYKIIYCSTENNRDKTKELIEVYKDRHVDGYIVVAPDGVEKEINDLCARGKPVVLLDRYLPNVNTDYVLVDNFNSAYNATNYLIKNGFRNIAFITINSLQVQMIDRLLGFEKAIKENGCTQHVKEIAYHDSEEAVKHIVSLLNRTPEIDAIFFATNYLCVSGLRALKSLNLKIPADVGVVCFDDYELFELYTPSITSIAQPTEAIAENAISLLLSRLKKGVTAGKFQKIILPTSFIIRESSEK
jgi:LacI family transcriptional regulator